ncbi:hypothetical protein [Desulfolucanica intricata]|uniref:hypothetical protein n=1 Tax=Desulfolucanica intricata TaxID=1285191 RepID=UPI00082B2689|nr:hypothetical protein [Desulfolucanica intricata]
MSDGTACKTLVNKTGDFVSVGLNNDHTVRGTVVGIFGNTLVLNGAAVIVGGETISVPFYWVDCAEIAWFN